MKIGLIQNKSIAGDLSGNLRRIVQSARICLDKGADTLVASAQALDGAFVSGLAERSSFLLQAQAALAALAAEVSIPLILASHAAEPGNASRSPRPYLLCQGRVELISDGLVTLPSGKRLFVNVAERPVPPPRGTKCDVILHLPTAPWTPARNWARTASEEAQAQRTAVAIVQGLGCYAGALMAGGSAAADASGKRTLLLPEFEAAECTWNTGSRRPCAPQTPPDTLLRAVCFYLREMLQNSGAAGYAVAAEGARAPLLLALARLAVGAQKVSAPTWEAPPALPLAKKRPKLPMPQAAGSASAAWQQRLKALQLTTYAEDHDLLLLNPLTLSDLLLGQYNAPASLLGTFAPLGDMLESEIETLRAQAQAALPPSLRSLVPPCRLLSMEDETALRLLALENMSPVEIAVQYGMNETLLRRLVRQLHQAPRHSWPTVLNLHGPRPHIPAEHQLVE